MMGFIINCSNTVLKIAVINTAVVPIDSRHILGVTVSLDRLENMHNLQKINVNERIKEVH